MGASVEAAPGGDGLIIGRGRVRQARKVPVRPGLAWVAGGGLVLAVVAGLVAWLAATLAPRWEPLGEVGPVAASVFVVALMLGAVALVGLVLVVAVPYETWGLYGATGADKFDRRAARRLARWWPRKSGQVVDAIRGDDGRFYRPSVKGFDFEGGRLIVVLVLPRVLKGADLDGYLERLHQLGPDVLGVYELAVREVESGYWATQVRMAVTHSDCAATTRSVLDRLGSAS